MIKVKVSHKSNVKSYSALFCSMHTTVILWLVLRNLKTIIYNTKIVDNFSRLTVDSLFCFVFFFFQPQPLFTYSSFYKKEFIKLHLVIYNLFIQTLTLDLQFFFRKNSNYSKDFNIFFCILATR